VEFVPTALLEKTSLQNKRQKPLKLFLYNTCILHFDSYLIFVVATQVTVDKLFLKRKHNRKLKRYQVTEQNKHE